MSKYLKVSKQLTGATRLPAQAPSRLQQPAAFGLFLLEHLFVIEVEEDCRGATQGPVAWRW
ncbi:hypothetical protein E2C01_080135 [Portunus trituberculatus]|uniref:Uncharacterized protein n=1 Tax=Portunus trituberculatus TaxID=210409 RepID=A0A5B7ISC7_PORTR|nr:hypothetical protein [Portunus trituberculatus]